VKKTAARAAPDSATANSTTAQSNPSNREDQSSGATDAAAILTAVDEDEEGAEEAQLPEAFDYHSDPEDGDES